MKLEPLQNELISLYKELSDLTQPKCAACQVPSSCCGRMYCDIALDWAKDKWGVELEATGHPTLPFMGEKGCVVPPHLRPLCTLHHCDINSIGVFRNDETATNKYFNLRNKIEELEYFIGH